jgi:hypothetical protein
MVGDKWPRFTSSLYLLGTVKVLLPRRVISDHSTVSNPATSRGDVRAVGTVVQSHLVFLITIDRAFAPDAS